jgi:hypothetical protein
MLASAGYEKQGFREGGGYRLKASEVVRKGRRRELIRTVGLMTALFLMQLPLVLTALGWLHSEADIAPVVPGRLSLAVDLGFILTRLFVAYRAAGLLRSRRAPRRWIQVSRAGVVLVLIGAAGDLWENVRLWSLLNVKSTDQVWFWLTFHQAFGGGGPGRAAFPWYSAAVIGASAVGLAAVLLPLLRRDDEKDDDQKKDHEKKSRPPLAQPEQDRADSVVICCSGGGIRASAFSLGGLQQLQSQGIYAKADAVVGVSGGGYVAAAYHVVRWNTADGIPTDQDWNLQPTKMPPYALDSPETQWLRRHTKYVLDSVSALIHATLSLAFGMAVNLLLVVVAIGSMAWLLAWLFLASGRLHPWDSHNFTAGMGAPWGRDWTWALDVWMIPAAGVALFVLEKGVDRFLNLPPKYRPFLRVPIPWLICVGGALTALVLAVPWIVESLSEYTARSGSVYAGFLHQIGFLPTGVCNAVLATKTSACGVSAAPDVSAQSALTVGSVSVAAVVSSILAVLASAKGAPASKSVDRGALAGFLGKVWAKVKDPVVPYVAVTIIAVVAVVFFLHTVTRLIDDVGDPRVNDDGVIADWKTGATLAALLIVARLLTDANRTSMHHFFRERISEAFFVHRTDKAANAIDYKKPLRFSRATPQDGGPRLVACAVANVSDQEIVPSKRGCTPFVFGHNRMGLTDKLLPEGAARRGSSVYEFAADEFYRDATIPAAVAISAAAFSPLAGRENVRVGPYRVVLALGNARLGVWLPNPIWIDESDVLRRLLSLGRIEEAATIWAGLPEVEKNDYLSTIPKRARELLNQFADPARDNPPPDSYPVSFLFWRKMWMRGRGVFKKPGMFSLIREAVGKASLYDRFLYVTDGGHYDNLGLIEALRRRPKEIYVLDASNDPEDTFRALGRAIATARIDLNCELVMDPRGMRRLARTRSGAAWCVGDYTFADGAKGKVYLAKAILLEGLPWDVEAYAFDNKDFPHTSTGKQLYGEFDFEAYRALGSNAVRELLKSDEYLKKCSSPASIVRAEPEALSTQDVAVANPPGKNGDNDS